MGNGRKGLLMTSTGRGPRALTVMSSCYKSKASVYKGRKNTDFPEAIVVSQAFLSLLFCLSGPICRRFGLFGHCDVSTERENMAGGWRVLSTRNMYFLAWA